MLKMVHKTVFIGMMFFLFSNAWTQHLHEEQGDYGTLPMEETRAIFKFIPNQNQWNSSVLYKASIPTGNIYIEQKGIVYDFFHFDERFYHQHSEDKRKPNYPKIDQSDRHVIRAIFKGSQNSKNTHSLPTKEYYNFYLGKNPAKWASKVHGYYQVGLEGVYKGIDLRYYNHKDFHLKYDWIVAPKADPTLIQIQYLGAKSVQLDKEGNLRVSNRIADIIEEKPYSYQLIDGQKREVPCRFHLTGTTLSFEFPEGYDTSKELIIDPKLIFSRSVGSTADSFGMTATYDLNGNFYAGGVVFDAGYPLLTPIDSIFNDFVVTPLRRVSDVVISKYSSDGTTLLHSTYLGGTNYETVHSLIVDHNNNLFLYGVTGSNDFPVTTDAYDTTFAGGSLAGYSGTGFFAENGTDIFVAKLNEAGDQLMNSTYIGGSENDGINSNEVTNQGFYMRINRDSTGAILSRDTIEIFDAEYDSLMVNYGDQFRGEIMVDSFGNCYIASSTRSDDFPIVNGFQNQLAGMQDGIAFRLSPDLGTLDWSTYIGGKYHDAAYSIKLDTLNNAYISGGTVSADFPVNGQGAFQRFNGGSGDAFIVKIDPTGNTLLASTFLGSGKYDQAYFIELDKFGDVYVTGQTMGNFPTTKGVYLNSGSTQFITKFDGTLNSIDYSTVFGNRDLSELNISPSAFLVDECGNIYVSGWGTKRRTLKGMPLTRDAFQNEGANDGYNFYLIVLARDATELLYGTYFGGDVSGEHVDGGTSRFDKNGVIYQAVCSGCGGNQDFPTTFPTDPSSINLSSNCNIGIFKFDFEIGPIPRTYEEEELGCAPYQIELKNLNKGITPYYWILENGDSITDQINPIRNYDLPGTYENKLVFKDSICNFWDTLYVDVRVVPEIKLNFGDTAFCDTLAHEVTMNTNGSANLFLWSTYPDFRKLLNDDLTDSTILIEAGLEQTIYVKAANDGCEAADTLHVDFSFVTMPSDTTVCQGDILEFEVEQLIITDPINLVSWTPETDIIDGLGTKKIRWSAQQNTGLNVKVLTDAGCLFTKNIKIEVPQIQLEVPDNAFFCDSSTHRITAESHKTADSYLWSTTSTYSDTVNIFPYEESILLTPQENQWYFIKVQNEQCILEDSVLFGSNFLIYPDSLNICGFDTARLSLQIFNPQDVLYNIKWNPEDNIISGQSTKDIEMLTGVNADFNVEVNTENCYFNQTSNIQTLPSPQAKFSTKTELIQYYSQQVEFTDASSDDVLLGLWNFGDSTTLPYSLNDDIISHSYDKVSAEQDSIKVYLVVQNQHNCKDTAWLSIPVDLPVHFYVPNAFSPNSDGVNDVFLGVGEGISHVEMSIFNRWGDLIYKTDQMGTAWDGFDHQYRDDSPVSTSKDEFMDAYVYLIKVKDFKNREQVFRGVVHLIR